MTTINVDKFKKTWFSYEEIESIKKWIEDVENGRTVSESQMKKFIKKELFSKYTVNV